MNPPSVTPTPPQSQERPTAMLASADSTSGPVVAELLEGVRAARRAFRRTLYVMSAIYIASIAIALTASRTDWRDLHLDRFGKAGTGVLFLAILGAVVFGLWLLNHFTSEPAVASPDDLRRYLRNTRRAGRGVVIVYMASWCLIPHLVRLGWCSTEFASGAAPMSFAVFAANFANLSWIAVQKALSFVQAAATEPPSTEAPRKPTFDSGFRSRLAAGSPGASLFASAAIPLPWVAESFGAATYGRAATAGPPIWAFTVGFWIAAALAVASRGRSSRRERILETATAFARILCLLFASVALSYLRPSEDSLSAWLAVSQIATMAAANLLLGARANRTAIAGGAALP